MKWLEIVYCYFWYFSEFAVTKTHLRRPFTFIMRDTPWIYACLSFFIGVCAYLGQWLAWRIFCSIVWALVTGHVWWGARHIVGQQEEPIFDPLHPVKSVNLRRDVRNIRRQIKERNL